MNNIKIRKIVVFIILTIALLFALYSVHKSEIDYINREIDSFYYNEHDVDNLEYLLKEYNDDPIKETDRKMIIYGLLNNFRDNNYQFTDGDIKDYIKELENNSNNYSEYENDYYYNDMLIKRGNYHNLAIALLNSRNDELTDENVSENIMNLQYQIEIVVILIFIALYVYFVFKFAFFTEFDKKNYIKIIVKYLLALFIIFVCNIAVVYASNKYINYLGNYRGRGFYQFWNVPNILDYGILTIIQLLIVFIISLLINAFLNIKDIKKHFKTKK